jgi:hypothetical protein
VIGGIGVWFASFFAKEAVVSWAAVAWKCLSNPLCSALIAGTLLFGYGTIRENRVVHREWAAADVAATARNERQRQVRDAIIAGYTQANAEAAIAPLQAHATALEKQVQDYETYLSAQPKPGVGVAPDPCILSSADEQRMRFGLGRKAVAPSRHILGVRPFNQWGRGTVN